MLKILLPVDFSEGTYQACQYALQLSPQTTGTQLLLVHCFQDYLADADKDHAPTIDQTPSAAIAENIIYRNETEAFEQMEALFTKVQAELQGQSNIYLKRKVVHGSPEDCIPEQIKEFQADLLVMHTDGESGLARSLFGTITTQLVDNVQIPVLTVPKNSESRTISRVLYATNFDETDVTAIQQLSLLLQPVNASIMCVHVSEDPEDNNQERLQTLQQKLQRSEVSNIQFVLLPGDDVADSLLDFVQKEHIDLVSLASREHSTWSKLFNQSLAKKLVLESQTPLLIFHVKNANS